VRKRSRRQIVRIDPSAARLQEKIDALTSELRDANARIAELTSQLERQAALLRNLDATAGSSRTLEPLLTRLTKREREVALLFSQCACDKTVAHLLGIAVQTVRNQIASILTKLDVNSRDQLLVLLLSGGSASIVDSTIDSAEPEPTIDRAPSE